MDKSRIFDVKTVKESTMGIQIQSRDLEKYWEIHLWLEDGQYWTALNVSEVLGPKVEDKKQALKYFEQAHWNHEGELRLVQYTPRVLLKYEKLAGGDDDKATTGDSINQ